MLRDLADISAIVATALGGLGVFLRWHFKQRQRPNLDHIRKLEKENREIDEITERIRKGDQQR